MSMEGFLFVDLSLLALQGIIDEMCIRENWSFKVIVMPRVCFINPRCHRVYNYFRLNTLQNLYVTCDRMLTIVN